MTSHFEDFFGQELNIGDEVAVVAKNYRHLVMGTVVGFTPKCVRVKYMNTWNYGPKGLETDFITDSKFLIKKF